MKSYNEKNDMYLYEAEIETAYFIRDGKIDLKLMNAGVTNTVTTKINFKSIKIIVQDDQENDTAQASDYGVPNIVGKGLINVFALNDVELIRQYTDNSYVQIEDIDANKLKLLSIPLFGYDYVTNTGYSVYNDVYAQMDYIHTKWLETQTNFVSTLKFANTYGTSKNHIIGNDNERLDKTNISLNFKVALAYNATVDMNYVKDYIRDYFSKIDFINDETFHVSDLIRKVRDDIVDVTKIEFVGINGYNSDYQYIEANYDPDDPSVIPEIVNIEYDKNKSYKINIQKI